MNNTISGTVLIVINKNKLNPSSQENHRPIAIASAAAKKIEKVILRRLLNYLDTSNMQFGFKKGHSTDLCIFALKEVFNYYRKFNNQLFICFFFLEIKSVFDRVSSNEFFCKLVLRGVPKSLVLLFRQWYVAQRIYVRNWAILAPSFST